MADDTDLAIPGGRSDAVAYGDRMGVALFGWGVANRNLENATLALFRKLVHMTVRDATERGLVFAILEDTEDPAHREVYADWLEENGRNEEAHAERQAAKRLRQYQTERAVREQRQPQPWGLTSGAIPLSARGWQTMLLSGATVGRIVIASGAIASGAINISPISRRSDDRQEGP